MLLRFTALFVWALAAASAVFWGLRSFSAAKPVPPGAAVGNLAATPTGGPLAKVLGVTPPPVVAQRQPVVAESRFKLLGVVAPKQPGDKGGVALIAVGDEFPRPYHVGSAVEGNSVLLAVASRGVEIGPRGGPATVRLELPDPESAPRPSAPPPTPQRPAPGGMMQPGVPVPQPAQILPVRPPLHAPSAPNPQNGEDEDE